MKRKIKKRKVYHGLNIVNRGKYGIKMPTTLALDPTIQQRKGKSIEYNLKIHGNLDHKLNVISNPIIQDICQSYRKK